MQYGKSRWRVLEGAVYGLTRHEDVMVSRYRGQADLQELAQSREQVRHAEGDDSLLVARPMSQDQVSKAVCPEKLQLFKMDPEAAQGYDAYRDRQAATEMPEMQKPISAFEQWWLAMCTEPIAVDQILDVFGYIPKRPAFTEEEQDAFVEHARKIMQPGIKQMKEVGRHIGRISPMPGKSHTEMVQNYYNRKYLKGICDKHPLPPRPSRYNKEKNLRNGFTATGGIRRKMIPETPQIRVERAPRMRKPSSKATRCDSDAFNSELQHVVRGNAKRSRTDSLSPTPAPKRAKTQKSSTPVAFEKMEVAMRGASHAKRKLEDFCPDSNATDHAESPQKRRKAGQGSPKNIDEAFLKIVKKRFSQVKESGKQGDAFTKHFLGHDFNLPALIPYDERPIRKSGPETKRVAADTPAQKLKMPKETFILAQQCLILTHYILQEQRKRVEPGTTRRFNTSQWQHCAFGDANNLHDLGDQMASKGMFSRDWCPALYDRAERDLATLARWEDENAPAEGFWPEKDFCKPRMVWRPEIPSASDDFRLGNEGEEVHGVAAPETPMNRLAQPDSIIQDVAAVRLTGSAGAGDPSLLPLDSSKGREIDNLNNLNTLENALVNWKGLCSNEAQYNTWQRNASQGFRPEISG